jgi:transcriptional regulator GlxA family with amidase domain
VNAAGLLVVGVLALPGVYNTDFVAPIDVFDHVRFHSQPATGMKVVVIAPKKSPVRTDEGVTVTPDYGLDDALELDGIGIVLDWEAERGRARGVVVGAAP